MKYARQPVGFPGYYVTPWGAVYSLHRGRIWRLGQTPRRLYLAVHVKRESGKKKVAFVHRLVLLAFVGPPPSPEHETRHLNGNPWDNCIWNLEWGTPQENTKDKMRHGTILRGEAIGVAKITSAIAKEIKRRARYEDIRVTELAREYGISRHIVKRILRGGNWRHA